MINSQRLLERFLAYTQIDTGANEQSSDRPSSTGQTELAKQLVQDLQTIGLKDAVVSDLGVVYATIPSNLPEQDSESTEPMPVIGFCAHMDTAPDVPTGPVKPNVIQSYPGGDILLASGAKITVEENPELNSVVGTTVITTDGTTLLGADDKTGLAILVELAALLTEHPEIPHGKLRLCFSTDEEIGRGTDSIDLERLGVDFCYTLDSEGTNGIDVETFSADAAVVKIIGRNIHPSIGKGRMINAIRAAALFLNLLPSNGLSPETTDGRDGFIHPVSFEGDVEQTKISFILRSFETEELTRYRELLCNIARQTREAFPGLNTELSFRVQYRNMRDGLEKDPRAVLRAEQALKRLGRTPRREIVRGGTDGSRLTEMGIPTPNLTSGQHSMHSVTEWASLSEMEQTLAWVVEIARQ